MSFDWQSERRERLGKRFDHLIHSLQHRIYRYLQHYFWLDGNLVCLMVQKYTVATSIFLCCFFFCPVGPKLYKEPSAKSNKHIIQNALAHCCLAGKVNEGQKNKILDVWK